jgi:hypothetical protein
MNVKCDRYLPSYLDLGLIPNDVLVEQCQGRFVRVLSGESIAFSLAIGSSLDSF